MSSKQQRTVKNVQTEDQRVERQLKRTGMGEDMSHRPTDDKVPYSRKFNHHPDMLPGRGNPFKPKQPTFGELKRDIKKRQEAEAAGEVVELPAAWGNANPTRADYLKFLVESDQYSVVAHDGWEIFHPQYDKPDEKPKDDDVEDVVEYEQEESAPDIADDEVVMKKSDLAAIMARMDKLEGKATEDVIDEMLVEHLPNGSTITMGSSDGKLQGESHDVIYMNEVNEIPPEALKQFDTNEVEVPKGLCSNYVVRMIREGAIALDEVHHLAQTHDNRTVNKEMVDKFLGDCD